MQLSGSRRARETLRLRCVRRPTVQRGLSPVLRRGVPLFGPLPVSVAMVAVTSVRPSAQGDVDPDVQSAVACETTRNTRNTVSFYRPARVRDSDRIKE